VELVPLSESTNAGALQCLVAGRVVRDSAGDTPVELALAVKGTIRAVTRTYQIEGRENDWRAMLPEEAVPQPAHDIEVFVVDSTGSTPRLSRAIVD
jgi:hypothetical protein